MTLPVAIEVSRGSCCWDRRVSSYGMYKQDKLMSFFWWIPQDEKVEIKEVRRMVCLLGSQSDLEAGGGYVG
jgi:hypothetical protein